MKDKKLFDSFSMKLFLMLSIYFLSILILYSITSLININNILGIIEIISIIIPIIYVFTRNKDKKNYIAVIIFLFLVLVLPFLYNKTYDITYDGNTYHKTAIAFIKNGYNPIHDNFLKFQEKNKDIIKVDKHSKNDIWVEHYPKATWIIAATIYNLTGNIESGKCITLILTLMLFILSYNTLIKILNRTWALLLSTLIIINPIVMVQFFSYYVDGILGICFLIQLILLFYVNFSKKQDKDLWISIISSIVLLSNLKYTGLMCSGVISALFYFCYILKYRKDNRFLSNFKKITMIFILTYFIAVGLVGANSYVKNTINHKNPLYPIVGKDKIDIITNLQPKSYGEMSKFKKFTYSLFSKTENTIYVMIKPTLKMPYRIYKSEFYELNIPDTRSAGFGPYFAFSLILSLIIFIPSLIIFIKNNRKNIHYPIIFILSIIISIILIGEAWWARYIPQFYYLVLGNIILGVYASKYVKFKKIYILISFIPIITLIINASFLINIFGSKFKIFKSINDDLNYMKTTSNLKIRLTDEALIGYLYNLKDLNIKYTYINQPTKNKIYRYAWQIQEVEDE